MARSRATLTVPIVLAIVLLGVFAMQSRAKNDADQEPLARRNCAPVARADAVATSTGTPVRVDVLANDTDADGDRLVFQILRATGGTATVDEGSAPLDADDDRLLFTPDSSAAPGVVAYQAVDPDGAKSESLVTVVINADGALPAGVASEEVGSDAGRCGPSLTTTTVASATTATTVDSITERGRDSRPPPRATTRTPPPTVSSRTTAPAQPQPTPTTRPAAPNTTRPNSPPQTTPRECGPPPTSGSDAEEDAWARCVEENSD